MDEVTGITLNVHDNYELGGTEIVINFNEPAVFKKGDRLIIKSYITQNYLSYPEYPTHSESL